MELVYRFKLTTVQIDGPSHSNSYWMVTIGNSDYTGQQLRTWALRAQYKKVFALSLPLQFPTKFPSARFLFLSLKSLGPFPHWWNDLNWTP